jgi:hypothetical protein
MIMKYALIVEFQQDKDYAAKVIGVMIPPDTTDPLIRCIPERSSMETWGEWIGQHVASLGATSPDSSIYDYYALNMGYFLTLSEIKTAEAANPEELADQILKEIAENRGDLSIGRTQKMVLESVPK